MPSSSVVAGIPGLALRLRVLYPMGVCGEEEDEMTVTNEYRVIGMSCSHCENAVRSEVTKVAGAERIEVSAATGALVVESSAPLDHDAVLAAVDEAWYEAVRV